MHRLVRPLSVSLSLALTAAALTVAPAGSECPPNEAFFPKVDLTANSYPLASAVGYFNADIHPDIAVAALQGAGVLVYPGAGAGQFLPPVAIPMAQPSNLLTADFNGDGRADLAVTQFTEQLSILLNDGQGSFTSAIYAVFGTDPRGLAVGDFDEDGIKDLAVACETRITLLRGLPNGTFTGFAPLTSIGAWGITTGDFDNDGITDLLVANGTSPQLTLFRGLGSSGVGNGTFSAGVSIPVATAQREVCAADFNNDGILDIATNVGGSVLVLIGQGTGGVGNLTYTSTGYPVISSSNSIMARDWTGDGILDLLVTDPGNNRVVMLIGGGSNGIGNGTFATPENYATGLGPVGIVGGDVNEDGRIDLIVANSAANSISWLQGRCTIPPPPGPPLIAGFTPRAGVVADIVVINGLNLANPTSVEFNGVSATIRSSFATSIETEVPPGATSGPISVATGLGTTVSADTFYVGEPPILTSAVPDSAKVGAMILLNGDNLIRTLQVSFGATSNAPFTILSNDQIRVTVDSHAVTGPITVRTFFGTRISSFTFKVLPPDPAARIVAVRDVPNDQGGKVTVAWLASDFDRSDVHTITGYRVWRRAPGFASKQAPATKAAVGRGDEVDLDFWEPLTTLPSAFLPGYAYVAATTQDSIEGSFPYTAFFVQALTADPLVFYNSPVDSAYSVDNLSPPQPVPFIADYGPSSGVAMHWGPSPAPDRFGFRLYRGKTSSFIPSPENLIAALSDTMFFDASGNMTHYYKVAAVDVHGNQSRFALVGPDRPTATLAVVVDRSVSPDRVGLVWDVSGTSGILATIYRRTAEGSWTALATRTTDGNGRIELEDADVEPGRRYGYRLGVMDAGFETFAAEIWIDVPSFTLALERLRPNPIVSADLELGLQLAGSHAHLDVFDVRGRRVLSRDFSPASSGRFSFVLPTRGMAAGVYLVRLQQDDRTESAKFVILQ